METGRPYQGCIYSALFPVFLSPFLRLSRALIRSVLENETLFSVIKTLCVAIRLSNNAHTKQMSNGTPFYKDCKQFK